MIWTTWRQHRVEAAVAALAVALLGAYLLITGKQMQASPPLGSSAKPVPWLATPAISSVKPITIPGIAPCAASQLAIRVSSLYVGGGMRDTSSWQISVRNMGTAPCFVGSTLDVRFISAHGKIDLTRLSTSGDIVYLAAAGRSSLPRYASQADGEIDAFCVLPTITAIDISPGPSLGTVRVAPGPAGGWGTKPCTGSDATYLAELNPADCCNIGYIASTQTAIRAPAAGRPGDRIRFLITLTNKPVPHSELAGTVNPTPTPLTLNPCPTYHEELEGIASSFHAYQLNCAGAASIPATASETFEMFIDIPASAQLGPSVLLWSIDGSPTLWQTARTNLEISSS